MILKSRTRTTPLPEPPPGPYPWPLPGSVGPPCKPPACFSWVQKLEWCYDNCATWYDFILKVVTIVLEENPDIIPPQPLPPGVIDGSNAAPGEVGEVRSVFINGNLTNITTAGILVSLAAANFSITAGDWEISTLLQVDGGQVLSIGSTLNLLFSPTDIPGNLSAYTVATAAAFQGAAAIPTLPCSAGPVRYNFSGQPVVLSFNASLWSGTGVTIPSAPFRFWCWARRMR